MAAINYVKRNDFLYVSLFYPRDGWQKLIKRAVIPFLDLSSARYGMSYICHFSTFRGDAIHFTILVKQDKNDFVLFLHSYFQKYFNEHPASFIRDQEEFDSVFMDFPPNSLQYGLHDFPFNGSSRFDLNMPFVLQETSAIFLAALSKAGAASDIMTLALHIYSSSSIYHQKFSENQEWETSGQVTDSQLQQLLDIQYDENIELVKQVMMNNYNIIYKKKLPGNQSWLNRWSALNKRVAENEPSSSSDILKPSYRDFIAYSKKQLGLNQDEEVLIRHFVNKAFNQFI